MKTATLWRASGLACLLALGGCRESDPGVSDAGKNAPQVHGHAMGCLFGLCEAPIPADSAGMAALAAKVADSALASGLAWAAAAAAYAPAPDTLQWIQHAKLGFTLRMGQAGLFPRMDVEVRIAGTAGNLVLKRTARAGQRKTLAGFPAVGRINYDPGLVLAGTTGVHGPILLWRGDVGLSSHFDNRYTGSTPKPVVWKAENPLWKNLPLTFPGTWEWMAAQDSLLAAPDPAAAMRPDPWYAIRTVPKGTLFKDTLLTRTLLVVGENVTFGSGSVLRDCMVLAGDVAIQGNARVENSLVYGRDRLSITGSPALTGQFLSRDSLYLEADSAFSGHPIFYVHGNPRKQGGKLHAVKAKGEAILLYGGAYHPPYESAVHMVVGPGVDLHGLIYSNGSATIGGTSHGSVLCANHIWMGRTGTTYVGFLVDAQFHPPDASVLTLPLLLEPLEAALVSSATSVSLTPP